MADLLRVLWMCNVPVSGLDTAGTGTWLGSMARLLLETGELRLAVVAPAASGMPVRQVTDAVCSYGIPRWYRTGADGLPRRSIVRETLHTVEDFAPDVVHVWGTESFWGLLVARGLINRPAVLTVQGIKSRIGQLYWGDLGWRERLACTGPKELARTLAAGGGVAGTFRRWAPFEREILAGFKHIACQSRWQMAYVQQANPGAEVEQVELPLRHEFLEPPASRPRIADTPRIFCSAGYVSPGKGLHTVIRAIALLRREYPAIELRIAGPSPGRGLMRDGYVRWLAKQIARLGLEQNVVWLGRLEAAAMAQEIRACTALAVPSFIESYCLAMAEAMAVGVPVVAAYTGGTGHLGEDERSCLFFPSGDGAACAYQLGRVLSDAALAARLAGRAREVAVARHEPQGLVRRQLALYRSQKTALCRHGEAKLLTCQRA